MCGGMCRLDLIVVYVENLCVYREEVKEGEVVYQSEGGVLEVGWLTSDTGGVNSTYLISDIYNSNAKGLDTFLFSLKGMPVAGDYSFIFR